MLGAGRERIRRRQIGALEPLNLGPGDAHSEQGIFARPLGGAPPAWIAGDIQHRREAHGQAVGRGFPRRLARRQRPGLRVEQAGLGQGNRKQGAVSMDDVEPDQQRNAETGFLHRQALHLAHRSRPDQVQQIADLAAPDRLGRVAGDDRPGHCIAGGGHRELAELFRQRHLAHQLLDPVHAVQSFGTMRIV